MCSSHSGRFSGMLLCVFMSVIPVFNAQANSLEGVPQCEAVPPLAMDSLPEDQKVELAYCAIDFSSTSIALCPKTWSTSPGAVIYALDGTEWAGKAGEFEQQNCGVGGHARDKASRELGIFKSSLNGRKTSGTFAPASLLYYHFSRLLKTHVQVPPAVRVEFPLTAYHPRIVQPGLKFSNSKRSSMLHEGWLEVERAFAQPASYSHRRELFTADQKRLWGVILMEQGHRYGPEVSGTRASGWGDGQNRDFQKTAPFLALRTDLPLAAAIESGIDKASQDPAMASELPANISVQQVASWMRDITEIVILDYMLRQQDRIGNIDYLWRWQWLEGGQLRVAKAQPDNEQAVKLRVSVLNDNDAGVRTSYANYAKKTGMLDTWHHMDSSLYRRVQLLAQDFAESGEVAQGVQENYRLSKREIEGILLRGIEIADALRQRCEAGELRFDLDSASVLSPAKAREEVIDCIVSVE